MRNFLTPRRRENLTTLAEYLERLPKSYRHFSMEYHIDGKNLGDKTFDRMFAEEPQVAIKQCGSIACAVGHGPVAGIPLSKSMITRCTFSWCDDRPDAEIDWDAYAERNFTGEDTTAWLWLFGGEWKFIDNSPHGAAARIRYLLANNGKVPADFNDLPKRKHRALYQEYRVNA
jgi:hypothetical protein